MTAPTSEEGAAITANCCNKLNSVSRLKALTTSQARPSLSFRLPA